jgi:hypothetical protein
MKRTWALKAMTMRSVSRPSKAAHRRRRLDAEGRGKGGPAAPAARGRNPGGTAAVAAADVREVALAREQRQEEGVGLGHVLVVARALQELPEHQRSCGNDGDGVRKQVKKQ